MKVLVFFVLTTCIVSQIPVGDPTQTALLSKIAAGTTKIVTDNQIGLMQERKKLVQIINTAQNTYRSLMALKDIGQYTKNLYKDLTSISKWNIDSFEKLKHFIINGDRIDYWMNSSSYAVVRDLNKLRSAERNALLLEKQIFTDDEHDQKQNLIIKAKQELDDDLANQYENTVKQMALNEEKITNLKNMALDASTKATAAEREAILKSARDLEIENTRLEEKLKNIGQEILDNEQGKLNSNLNNKRAKKTIDLLYRLSIANTNYGFFNTSKLDNHKDLKKMNW